MKTLVTYFSAQGHTKKQAERIAQLIDADLYEITPAIPYTRKDLIWLNPLSRSSKEMKDSSSRPAIQGRINNFDDYELILVGFPIWWYKAPTIINTFLESYDFKDKTIGLFATSGSSDFGDTQNHLEVSAKPKKWLEPLLINRKCTNNDIIHRFQ